NKRLIQDLQQARQQEGAASSRVKELEVDVLALKKEAAAQHEAAALRERGTRAASDDQDRAAAERQIWQKQMETTLSQFDQERRQLCKAYERLRQEVNDMRAGRVSTVRAPK